MRVIPMLVDNNGNRAFAIPILVKLSDWRIPLRLEKLGDAPPLSVKHQTRFAGLLDVGLDIAHDLNTHRFICTD